MDKVKELVEWAANIITKSHDSVKVDNNGLVTFVTYPISSKDIAKQILSHPDLALIDREFEKENGREIREESGCFDMLDEEWALSYKPIIPLVEALKEE